MPRNGAAHATSCWWPSGASIGAPASYHGKQNFAGAAGKNGKRSSHAVLGLDKYHGQEIFLTEALTLEANAHIADAVKADKPFFLYFPQYAVHAPFNSDPRFAANYANSGKPANAQAFATLIEGMDKSLGDVLNHLEKLGVAENTLFIFLGDNGSDAPLGHQHEVACAAPLRGKKGSHYEGGVRVPFIAAWAKPSAANAFQQRLPIAVGVIQSQQAAVYDLFPTLLALTGHPAPASHAVDGARLDALLTGKRDSLEERRCNLPTRCEETSRNGEVETGAGLLEIPRSEVCGDAPEGEIVSTVGERRSHTLTGLPDRGVGKPHDGEGRKTPVEIDLYVHRLGIDPDERKCPGDREHRRGTLRTLI